MKDVIYRSKPTTLGALEEETEKSCADIPVANLATVTSAPVRRTQKCLQANGGRFEHLLQFNMCRSNPFICVSNLDY
jgi:hypothetical protein